MSGTDTVDTVGLPNEPRSDSGNEGTIDVHLQPPPIRLGYLLILFGALTVAGSLAPAVWRWECRRHAQQKLHLLQR